MAGCLYFGNRCETCPRTSCLFNKNRLAKIAEEREVRRKLRELERGSL